jgi:hypothetical protein
MGVCTCIKVEKLIDGFKRSIAPVKCRRGRGQQCGQVTLACHLLMLIGFSSLRSKRSHNLTDNEIPHSHIGVFNSSYITTAARPRRFPKGQLAVHALRCFHPSNKVIVKSYEIQNGDKWQILVAGMPKRGLGPKLKGCQRQICFVWARYSNVIRTTELTYPTQRIPCEIHIDGRQVLLVRHLTLTCRCIPIQV